MATTVGFLLSDQTDWVTGAVWDIDGGVMAGRNRPTRSAENQVSDVLVGSHSGPAPARSSAGSNRHSGLNRRPTASLGSVASRLSRNP